MKYLTAGKESRQEVSTPMELITFVERLWGKISFDLAASPGNAVADNYFTEEDDALSKDWSLDVANQICWLNPPFGRIGPWAKKCRQEAERSVQIISLVPNTQEAKWFWDWVLGGPCTVHPLKGRIAFPGYFDKCGKPQVAGQGHCLIDWHGQEWGGIHPLDWRTS